MASKRLTGNSPSSKIDQSQPLYYSICFRFSMGSQGSRTATLIQILLKEPVQVRISLVGSFSFRFLELMNTFSNLDKSAVMYPLLQ